MRFSMFKTLLLLAGLIVLGLSQQNCPACSCKIGRPPVLDTIISTKISNVMNGQPIVRMLRIYNGNSRTVFLQRSNTTTLSIGDAQALAQISLSNPAVSVTDPTNTFAYRPSFSGNHNSRLGTLFINIERVFPCVANTDYNAICRVFTDEDDGFRGGRAVLDSGDDGNTFRIFGGTNIETYGLAFQNCPQLNTTCFPNFHSLNIVCHLPATCDTNM